MGIYKETIDTQWLGRGIVFLFFILAVVATFVPSEMGSTLFGVVGVSIVILSLIFCLQFCVSLEPFEEFNGHAASMTARKFDGSPEVRRSLYLEYGPKWQERISQRESVRVYRGSVMPTSRPIQQRQPRPKMSKVTDGIWNVEPVGRERQVSVLRGGEFLGNRLRFKVKVLNETEFTVTDVTIWLISYPKRAMTLTSEDHVRFPKIEPEGFRSPHFDLLPTQDCVKGDIVAGVSYVDARGHARTLTTMPYAIRAVCDLLRPERITPDEFKERLVTLDCSEVVIKVEEWTAEEMFEKALRILDDSNFMEVDSDFQDQEGLAEGDIKGWARGKYTRKNLAVQLRISGRSGERGASCKISVSGEDEAMILPAMEEFRDKLSTWLCPFCASKLTPEDVRELQKGEPISCGFCGSTIVH